MMRTFLVVFALCMPCLVLADSAVKKQKVLGAGPSTKIATVFFEMFAATKAAAGYSFEVEQRSTKHAGGIRASGSFLFGRTGRPLNDAEKAQDKRDLFLATVPVGFVVGDKVGIKQFSIDQVRSVYCGDIDSWQELGGSDHEVHLLGREPTEASLTVLRQFYPFLDQASYERVLKRDHAVINFLKTEHGAHAIAYGPLLNFAPEHRVEVSGYAPGLKMGLVYDIRNADHPLVQAAIRFAASAKWQEAVSRLGFLPPSDESAVKGRVALSDANSCRS